MSEPFSGFCVHFGVLKACAFWVSCPACLHCCKLAAAGEVCHQAIACGNWGCSSITISICTTCSPS